MRFNEILFITTEPDKYKKLIFKKIEFINTTLIYKNFIIQQSYEDQYKNEHNVKSKQKF